MWTHGDPCLTVSMFVAEVPQVDRQLAQLVVPKIPVSEQSTEQRESQGTLAPHAGL